MAISLKEIRTERQWRASTGLNQEQFLKLVGLFGLYSIKSGLTYDLLALSFDLAPPNAFQMQALSLQVLQSALAVGGYMLTREYSSEEELKNIGKRKQIS